VNEAMPVIAPLDCGRVIRQFLQFNSCNSSPAIQVLQFKSCNSSPAIQVLQFRQIPQFKKGPDRRGSGAAGRGKAGGTKGPHHNRRAARVMRLTLRRKNPMILGLAQPEPA
jgi:hypothetical protein